jgi:hypothetical protein
MVLRWEIAPPPQLTESPTLGRWIGAGPVPGPTAPREPRGNGPPAGARFRRGRTGSILTILIILTTRIW